MQSNTPSKNAPKTDPPENHWVVFVRRCVTSRASARSKLDSLVSSTPRASSCRTKASNWSDANASRKVTCLRSISSPNERIEAQLAAETPHGLFRGTLYRELDSLRGSATRKDRRLPHPFFHRHFCVNLDRLV